MNHRYLLIVLAIALGVGGCASTTSNVQSSARYENGSYYSPAEAGYGDYYYAPEPRNDYYGDPFFYGSSFYAFGGYCPAVYGYCSPFWVDPFWGPFGFPSPYYGYHHHHHSHGNDHADAQSPSAQIDDADDSAASDDNDQPRPTRGRLGAQRQEVERRQIRMTERSWPGSAPAAARESSGSESGQGRRSRHGDGG
jgi:hypothetical protein